MKPRKTFFRGVRLTERTDLLIDILCNVLNKKNQKINGDSDITGSVLLTQSLERAAHAPTALEREMLLVQFFLFSGLKDEFGSPISQEKAKEIAREVFLQDGLR